MCSNAKSEAFGVARRAFAKGLPFARWDTGSARLDEKKDTHQFKEEVSKQHNKRVGLYIPRDIFFLNITHEGRRRRRSSSVFFRGGFFHEFLVWARHTRFIGLPFVAKKGAFSISFVDTQQ